MSLNSSSFTGTGIRQPLPAGFSCTEQYNTKGGLPQFAAGRPEYPDDQEEYDLQGEIISPQPLPAP
jgi:hypothetical protein